MNKKEKIDLILRRTVEVYNKESLLKKLNGEKKLVVKFGADPSRPDLHLGHTVPLRALKILQELGHEIVFVIGDFTAMIGDPSGKSKTRPSLSFDETRKNGETYFKQVAKILDPTKIKIVYNSEWLGKMNFEDVIKLTSKYTVARIMERDDFKNRFENNLPLSMHELLYPLLQGYDSVELKADIEIGGTDQTFNLLVGRELQKDYGQESQVVMTFPLLVGLDGKEKMSKSLDNYIGLTDSPFEKFEKSMKIPDNVLRQYFELATDLPTDEINKIMSGDIREAHLQFAKELLKMYDDVNEFESIKERYMNIAKGEIPENIEEIKMEEKELNICELLVKTGFANSKSEAKRMILGNGIKVDGKVVTDINKAIEIANGKVIQFGKNRFKKITKI